MNWRIKYVIFFACIIMLIEVGSVYVEANNNQIELEQILNEPIPDPDTIITG